MFCDSCEFWGTGGEGGASLPYNIKSTSYHGDCCMFFRHFFFTWGYAGDFDLQHLFWRAWPQVAWHDMTGKALKNDSRIKYHGLG